MHDYPLITYVAFAGVAAYLVLDTGRPNFRRGTNRRKAAADNRWWIAVGAIILALVLAR